MPELPEVETVRRTLLPKLKGRTIAKVTINMPVIEKASEKEFIERVSGCKVEDLGRRGKYLMIFLTGNLVMVIHLRMTGQLVYGPSEMELPKHSHVVFSLDNGDILIFADQRRFGRIYLLSQKELNTLGGLASLGMEPLTEDFNIQEFEQALTRKTGKIKAVILDQTFIAGLGNIYADEALFRAGIAPGRPANTLTEVEREKLFHAIEAVIEDGIANRGTSIRDYVDGEGQKGGFQNLLRVYKRNGQPCHTCETTLEKTKVGGRSSHFCPKCQN